MLLCGLPDEYETLITALEARDEDELTLEYVKIKLVDAYERKKDSEADSTESRTESAMYSGKIRPHSHMNNRTTGIKKQEPVSSVKDKDI